MKADGLPDEQLRVQEPEPAAPGSGDGSAVDMKDDAREDLKIEGSCAVDTAPYSGALRKKDQLADDAPPLRPGVTNRTLRENGIHLVKAVSTGSCLRIPYFKPREESGPRKPIRDAGSAFYRERLLDPANEQPKYRQPKGAIPHAYFPNGSFDLINECRMMIVTEGEFKALSLEEAGYAAIGIGGINNFAADGSLVREIEFLFTQCEPRTIAFLGDADTALNPQFSNAAIMFQKLVIEKYPRAKFTLPRMPLAEPGRMKGIDDAREVLGHKGFETYFKSCLAELSG